MNEKDFEKKVSYIIKKTDPYTFDDLCLITSILRCERGCPWDKEQTHKSIRRDLIEECYEVIEAIDCEDPVLLQEELGDLMLQITMHAQMEKEMGRQGIDGVINDVCSKLVHRHPHVFGNVVAETSEKVLENWDKIKTEEKHRDTVTSKLRAIPIQFPALMRAQKVGKKADFFDFKDAEEARNKLAEESDEVSAAVKSGEKEAVFEEIGDLLFTAVSLSRKLGVDAEEALTFATNKFISRFEKVEKAANADGCNVRDLTQTQLDEIWEKIKHSDNTKQEKT